jgi:hypothetical protein
MAISKRLRFEVFKRDGFRCRYCGAGVIEVTLHCDHVVPESKGGPTVAENLVTACQPCNLGKSNVGLDERKLSPSVDVEDAKEHAAQIREYLKIQKQIGSAKNELEDLALQHWQKRMGEWHYSLPNYIHAPLKDFGLSKVMEAIDIVAGRDVRKPLDQVKYFCGIIKNWRNPRPKPEPKSSEPAVKDATATAMAEAEWKAATFMIEKYILHRTNGDLDFKGAKPINYRGLLEHMSRLKLRMIDLYHAIDISEWGSDELEKNVLAVLDRFAEEGAPDYHSIRTATEEQIEEEVMDRLKQETWHELSMVVLHFTDDVSGSSKEVFDWFREMCSVELGRIFVLPCALRAGPGLANLSGEEQRALLIKEALADERFCRTVPSLAEKWRK